MKRKRATNNLTQVSAHVPATVKDKLQALAKRNGTTVYAIVKQLIVDYVNREETPGNSKAAVTVTDTDIL